MYVVTADQDDSRRRADGVPPLLERLAGHSGDVVLPFERTVGDEVQALVAEPTALVDVIATLTRLGGWAVGVGIGPVERPLPDSARAGRGTAYVHARAAVERAKSAPSGVAVEGVQAQAATRAQTGLRLLAALLARRTPTGWQAVDLMESSQRQLDVARTLGISAQAVSRRLRVAGFAEEHDARDLAAWLLAAADPDRQEAPR